MLFPTLLLAGIAAAAPGALDKRQTAADICSSGTPYCCQLDVLGVADVTCVDPPGNRANVTDFQDTCAETGTSAGCCVLGDVLTLALICSTPQ
ncbi:Putative cerato-ulmin hydrophobin family, Hydrophobin superfamily [Septoria linicola]|uniref:Cerato-ulmin hydrophobin family, Hydrophobin superfamily n=1 Tax=Septoria linicola TaxID=215465 RepID=A0A9Q9AQV2_9PEZI|nr:Putative cerato-ulmin hydrophobin family, Hydrophobin superfamily [Septoria linicola]